MKTASVEIGGSQVLMDLPAFLRARADNPDIADKTSCPECGERVHTYNEAGALGFRVVNHEVGTRPQGNRRALPGFHHFDHQASDSCSLSFANDPRYSGVRTDNLFSAMDRARNREALDRPGAREAIAVVQTFFMQRLTGQNELSPAHVAELAKVEKRMQSMVGLADHLWVLGYLGPLLLGPQQRDLNGRQVRLEYTAAGRHELPFVGDDGQKRSLFVPDRLVLCFSPKRISGTPNPLRKGKGGPEIAFDVSRHFAVSLVRTAQEAGKYRLPPREEVKYPPAHLADNADHAVL